MEEPYARYESKEVVEAQESLKAFFAASRETVKEEPRSYVLRRTVALVAVALFIALTGLTVADHQYSVAGGHIWAQPVAQATPIPTGLIYCKGTGSADRKRIEAAAREIMLWDDVRPLIQELIDHNVCLTTETLSYNGGYTRVIRTSRGVVVTKIVVDKQLVSYLKSDELAAVLVHEATHAHRVFKRANCWQVGTCDILPNGVAVEEEVAAHKAEALFWIELHGPTGTLTGVSFSGTVGAAYENKLVAEYAKGSKSFRAYIIEIRSDPREGQDINDQ